MRKPILLAALAALGAVSDGVNSPLDYSDIGQEQLNISQAEAEHMVQPNSMTDDLGGKAMAVVRVGLWLHAATVAHGRSACQRGFP